jgi:hypothetical protein
MRPNAASATARAASRAVDPSPPISATATIVAASPIAPVPTISASALPCSPRRRALMYAIAVTASTPPKNAT